MKVAVGPAIALAGLLLVSLTGCKEGAVANNIAAVQNATKTLCKFVPTAATVGSIIAGGNPAVATVGGIASAICAAVGQPSAKKLYDSKCKGYVAGVCVEGEFVE